MPTDAISHRYADALVQWATSANQLDGVTQQVQTLNAVFADLGDAFYDVLANPSIAAPQKFALLADTLPGVMEPVKNLLFLLVEHQRIRLFPAVVEQVQAMVDAQQGRIRGTLTTAAKVDSSVVSRVADAVKARYNVTDVVLDAVVDERILGGAALQFGDHRIDGTFVSQLEKMTQDALVTA